jgi:ER degradation enhancer, mannosidase alpha-like 2
MRTAGLFILCVAMSPWAESAPAIDPAPVAARVREEMRFAWWSYKTYAWGHDELKPKSRAPHDWYGESLLLTPVDALDTLILLGFHDEAARARQLIVERLSFDRDASVQVFEMTIRHLGGLLSGYQLTGDAQLLELAEDLGTRLLPAFGSSTGMPYRFVHLRTGKTEGQRSNPAEIGTLALEFCTLARETGREEFCAKAKAALTALYDRRSTTIGLVGEEIDVETGRWTSRASHVGGGIDSYYEYLHKCALLTGDRDCARMWRKSKRSLERLSDDGPSGLWFGEVDRITGERTATEFGALHAFLPGLLALAGDTKRARRLEESCFKMWTLHGIEPEVLDYARMRVVHPGYPLRPEIVESAFYLWRRTKDERYRDMGRQFFVDLVAHCRTESGYTVLDDVVTKAQGDAMPSYFLAETLKYLYLLFASDDALDLDAVVLNTEGHPLRRLR